MSRWLNYILAAALCSGVAAIACYAILYIPFFIAVAKRDADSKRAFLPLTNMRPIVLDNRFGVYHVEFDGDSTLSDANVLELLTLNRLPDEYDLTLWLKTSNITDASIPVLSQLKTTDTIVMEDTGITEQGIAQLASNNPGLRICSPKGTNLAPQ